MHSVVSASVSEQLTSSMCKQPTDAPRSIPNRIKLQLNNLNDVRAPKVTVDWRANGHVEYITYRENGLLKTASLAVRKV